MPTPSTAQAMTRPTVSWAKARPASPTAKTAFVPINTGRPPRRSMAAPACGPTRAATISATLKAANTVGTEVPRSCAIGAARMAGR